MSVINTQAGDIVVNPDHSRYRTNCSPALALYFQGYPPKNTIPQRLGEKNIPEKVSKYLSSVEIMKQEH